MSWKTDTWLGKIYFTTIVLPMPDPQPVKKPLYPDVFFVKHLGADDHQELLLIELKSNKYASQYTYFLPMVAKQNVALFAKQWFPCNRHFFDILWLYQKKNVNLLVLVVFFWQFNLPGGLTFGEGNALVLLCTLLNIIKYGGKHSTLIQKWLSQALVNLVKGLVAMWCSIISRRN